MATMGVEDRLLYSDEKERLLECEICRDEDTGRAQITYSLNLLDSDQRNKKRIVKNVLVLSLGMFLYFSGFQCLANLQSTMNGEQGLGMNSQAIVYGTSMISAILLPDVFLTRLGCKWTLFWGTALSVPYIISNFYPVWQTLFPTAVLFGLASGPLTTAQGVYIYEMASLYHACAPCSLEVVLAAFTALLYFFYENTQIWSNLISYYVLSPAGGSSSHIHTNQTCGIDFHPSFHILNATNDSNIVQLPDEKRYILTSINTTLGLLSLVALGFLLDPLVSPKQVQKPSNHAWNQLLTTLRHLCHRDQVLLVPITIFVGLQLAFYTGDFTEAYIACYWGMQHVGFVVMSLGACGAMTAVLVGPLVKTFGQTMLLVTVAILHATIFVSLFKFGSTTNQDQISIWFFVISGVWGAADLIWWSQISALYGLVFADQKEAAYSNFAFWTAAGFFLSYSYANILATSLKVCILLGLLAVGTTGVFILRIKLQCSTQSSRYSNREPASPLLPDCQNLSVHEDFGTN